MSTIPPVPAQPLEYAQVQSRRPGIMTAVGIISIVVACLSGLSSCSGIASSAVFLAMGNLSIPTKTLAPAPGASGPSVTIDNVPWDPTNTVNGQPDETRQTVVSGLGKVSPLSPLRAGHLDLLLKVHGREMMPGVDHETTEGEIRKMVTDAGVTPARTGSATWYLIGSGRIEVDDQRALFRPSDGGGVAEASAGGSLSQAAPTTTGVTMRTKTVTLHQRGWVTSTTAPATAPAASAVPIMPFKIPPLTAWLSIIENVLSLGVAVLLLIAGILMLRDSKKARRLHWFYVMLKIPLVFFAAVAGYLLMSSMMSTMFGGGGVALPAWSVFLNVAMSAGMALLYPLALIFLLMSRPVREYYQRMDDPPFQEQR